MPWGDRKSFSAVVLTVTVWAGVSLAAWLLRPLIPPEDPFVGTRIPTDFGRRKSSPTIAWRPMRPELFGEARIQQKPLLLFLGSEANHFSRLVDRVTFGAGDVPDLVNRRFIPVRIDLVAEPGWRSLFLPLSRANSLVEPGGMVVFMRADGTILDSYVAEQSFSLAGEREFIRLLERVYQQSLGAGPFRFQQQQTEEATVLLTGVGGGQLDRPAYRESLIARLDPQTGGLREIGTRSIPRHEWRYLLIEGRDEEVRRSIDPILLSSQVDWLNGGLFTTTRDPQRRLVDYCRLALPNAQLAELLAQLDTARPSEAYRGVASQILRSLRREFITESGIYSYASAVVGLGDRSQAQSFTVPFLQRLTEEDQRQWQEQFDLDVRANPYLIPRIRRLDDLEARLPKLNELFARTRKTVPPDMMTHGGADLADQSARIVASTLRAATLLGDLETLDAANLAKERAFSLLAGLDDVLRARSPELQDAGSVSDYLAMAELLLTDYQLSQDASSLRKGQKILNRALVLFQLPSGLLRSDPLNPVLPLANLYSLPEVTDSDSESTTAQAIELLNSYAWLESDPAERTKLIATRDQMISAAAPAVSVTKNRVASFFAASLRSECSRIFFVRGTNAGAIALRLQAQEPSVPALVVAGRIREDLGNLADGVYIVSDTAALGPFSPAEALARLRQFPDR